MNILNPTCEKVLKAVIDNVNNNDAIMIHDLDNKIIDLNRKDVLQAARLLETYGYIRLTEFDNYDDGLIILYSEGYFYFQNKETFSDAVPSNQVNIYDSSGINVGNNNTVNINNGCDFEDLHNIINGLQVSNKETYHELINTLQDCIKNNKPIPKGKFSKAIEITQEIIPLFTAIGSLIFRYLA